MADRQYQIEPANRANIAHVRPLPTQIAYGQPDGSAPQSNTRYRRPVPSSAARSPPRATPRAAPTAYSADPAPPMHSQGPPSPTRGARQSATTPHQDPYGFAAAGGGMTGLATGLADSQPRDSGIRALRDIDNLYGGRMMSPSPEPDEAEYAHPGFHQPPLPQPAAHFQPAHQPTNSQSSVTPLMLHEQDARPRSLSPARWEYDNAPVAGAPIFHDPAMPAGSLYRGDGYDDHFDPADIAEDGDDVFEGPPRRQRNHSPLPSARAAGATAATAGSGRAGMFNGFGARSRDASGNYASVPNGNGRDPEKSEWLQKQSRGGSRMKWIIGIIIAVIIIGAIVGGVVGGVLASKNKSGGGSSSGSSSSSKGLYDINSSQVQQLLNNKALHKVFPGMDYTPLNAQYPDCLSNPPDQNNVTLDVAMLSQLTPAIRLYGTDCNQTEMVLTAVDKLGYNDTVKIWLGVWLGTNATTNSRQLQQMYDILDNYPSSHFAGIIVGNEVLFRKDMTATQLGDQLQSVRSNLTAKKISLPVATSDLGDDWTAALAQSTDIVMANIHPFFAGVTPDQAAGWSWNFWQTHDATLLGSGKAQGGYPKNIISEIGWPSEGGNDCGTGATCPNAQAGAVASVDNMNTFMSNWVCQSLTNGTTYFWFEAFDEPWKVIYNTPTDQWESKWGLIDSNRNVKKGLSIPDCGGQQVTKPY